MKIFITGAAGFIGSHLANTLCERGHTVIGFDNCSTGHPESLASASNSFAAILTTGNTFGACSSRSTAFII